MKQYFFLPFLLLIPQMVGAFDASCFEYRDEIASPQAETLRVWSDSQDVHAFQEGKLVPLKFTAGFQKTYFPYTSTDGTDLKALQDGNPNTMYDFPQYDKMKKISLHFSPMLSKNTFSYEILGDYGNIEFEISPDGKTYTQISEGLENYDLSYVRLTFPQYKMLRNVSLSELRFYKRQNYEFLIHPNSQIPLILYRGDRCGDAKMILEEQSLSIKTSFITNVDTLSYEVQWENNPDFDQEWFQKSIQRDQDSDGVSDVGDNCPFVYNPRQTDSYGSGRGDECSDGDGDGILGQVDNCMYTSNPDQADINDNKVGDACEFDADKDGVFDSMDNCIQKSNPDQKDTDGDEIGDACDNCIRYNPTQLDADGNKIGDDCERPEETLDTDADTVPDFKDNCTKVPNPDQKDTDGDTVGDVCDTCKDLKNSLQEDEDKNGIGDVCDDSDHDGKVGYMDNCPLLSNADQLDVNNNHIGDACEDDDFDGIQNALDNCRYVANFDQINVDSDAQGNACDDKDNRYIESNKGIFISLILFVVALFGFGIFQMLRKIPKDEG